MSPTGGRLLLDGRDMAGIDLRTYRQHLAIVPQEPLLFAGSVRDNITYGQPDLSDEAVRDALVAANAWEFVQRLPDGLATPLGDRGTRLSGGQKQRIAIARALIRDPRVLILDEATSALDTTSEELVREALDRLMAGPHLLRRGPPAVDRTVCRPHRGAREGQGRRGRRARDWSRRPARTRSCTRPRCAEPIAGRDAKRGLA